MGSILARCEAAIHYERVANDKARTRAAQPQHGRGDLFRTTKSSDWLFLQNLFHRLRFIGQHLFDHRRLDGARADRVDPNSSCGVFHSRALGKTDNAVLGRVVGGASWQANEATDGRAVDDCSAFLLTHLPQLMLHAVPNATKIDVHHTVILFAAHVRDFQRRRIDTGIVLSRVEATESFNRLFHHRRHLCLNGHVAANSDRFCVLRRLIALRQNERPLRSRLPM